MPTCERLDTVLIMSTSASKALFATICDLLRQGDSRANTLLPRLQEHTDYGPGWLELGHTLRELGRTDAALVAYNQSLSAPHPPLAAALGKADLLFAERRFDTLIPWLERAHQQWHKQPALYYRLGRAHYVQGNYDAALRAFNTAVKYAPDFAEAWFQLGLVDQDRGQLDAATEAYRRALAIQPSMHEAALNLGISEQERGNVDAALNAYARAFKSHPVSFNRIAQALTSAPVGRLWLNPAALRNLLAARA